MQANHFDEAVAVAFAAVMATPGRRFDLVPRIQRERRVNKISMGVGVAAALAAAPLLFGDAMDRLDEVDVERRVAEGFERRVDDLRGEVLVFDDDVEMEAFAQEQASRVDDLLQGELGLGTVVQQVAEAMPLDSFLLDMRLSRAGLEEPPTGYVGPAPNAVLSLSGVAESLDGVGRWMQAVEEVPVVEGIWLAQSAIGSYDSGEGIGAVFTVDAVVVEAVESDEDPEIEP